MFTWLLKKEYSIMAWKAGDDSQMMIGTSDEHNDSNVLDWFMTNMPDVESWCDLEFIRIESCWKLFSRFEFFDRGVFLHDLDP